ncbi:MAG: hypothetical protein WBV82_07680 [Myxococcaceae bacterium]
MRYSQLLTAAVFLPATLLVGCGLEQSESEALASADLQQSKEALVTTSTPQLLTSVKDAGTIRLSATHVYFVDRAEAAIRRVPKAGGAVETVLSAPGKLLSVEFALDDKYVYAVVQEGGTFGQVARAPLAGGQPEYLLGGDIYDPGIAVDGTHVYLTKKDRVVRFPKDGGIFLEPEVIASGQDNATAIAVDGSNVYWIDIGLGNPAIGCNAGEGKVRAWNKLTRATRLIASRETCPFDLAVDGSTLYWTTLFTSELRKISTWSYFSLPQTVARDVSGLGIAFDSSYVYLVKQSDRGPSLAAVSKFFGTQLTFTNTQAKPNDFLGDLAADAQNLYYIVYDREMDSAALMKLRK